MKRKSSSSLKYSSAVLRAETVKLLASMAADFTSTRGIFNITVLGPLRKSAAEWRALAAES